MALSLGATTPTALYLGTTAISAAYLGATQVYTTGGGDAYAIGGASPELVAAFTTQSDGTTAGEYYRKASSETTFSGLFTHSVSGLLTMFDSTGTLCYAPHNLQGYSTYLGANWGISNATLTANAATAPDGTETAFRVQTSLGSSTSFAFPSATITVVPGVEYKFRWWAKNNGGIHAEWRLLDISNAVNIVTYESWFADMDGSNWTLIEKTYTAPAGCTSMRLYPIGQSTATADLFMWGVHVVRNDLPMADNPDQSAGLETYVPNTTGAAKYLPRRNAYRYNSGWELAGMQMEAAAATNLLASSQDMDGTGWLTPTATLTDAAATGPDGTASLQNLLDDSASVLQRVIARVTASAGTDICASCYVAKDNDETRFPEFFIYDGLNGRAWHLNTKTGATALRTSTGSPTNATISVIDSGNFWRVALTMQVGTGRTAIDFQIRPAAGTVFGTYTDSATGSINAGFVQMETGLVPTSYIPTTGSTVTRAAETLTIAGADTPANTTAMSISMKGLMTYADTNGNDFVLARQYASASNFILFGYMRTNDGTGKFQFQQTASGTLDFVQTGGSAFSPGVNVPFSLSSRHTSSAVNAASSGTALTADTTPTALPDLSAADVSMGYTIGQGFNGFISEFRMWGADIGDSGIEEVTT